MNCCEGLGVVCMKFSSSLLEWLGLSAYHMGTYGRTNDGFAERLSGKL